MTERANWPHNDGLSSRSKPRSRRKRLLLGIGIGLCLAAGTATLACTVANGLHVPIAEPPDSATALEASAEAGTDASTCQLATWPQRPAEGPDGDGLELLFAMKDFDFGGSTGISSRKGYDLDTSCTCTCRSGGAETRCDDGPGGVDNALAALTNGVDRPKDLMFEPALRDMLAKGLTGLLIKLAGYNGTPDDRTVRMSFYESAGLDRIDGGRGPRPVPTFTKADRWSVSPGALIGNPDERVSARVALEAYVAGGVLVATFDTPFLLAGMEIDLKTAALVADVKLDPPRLENGVIVGRWEVGKAIAAFGGLTTGDTPVCRQPLYLGLLGGACAATDVRLLRRDDGEDRPCNAISVGIGFVAFEGTIGGLAPLEPLADCSDAGTVTCN